MSFGKFLGDQLLDDQLLEGFWKGHYGVHDQQQIGGFFDLWFHRLR